MFRSYEVLPKTFARRFSAKSFSPFPVAHSTHVPKSPDYRAFELHDPYWQLIPRWKDTCVSDFLNYKWQMRHTINNQTQLYEFLESVLPESITTFLPSETPEGASASDFIRDVQEGIRQAPMSVRLTPHILSIIDWKNPFSDPIRRQFIPLRSSAQEDHPQLRLDSLCEKQDARVNGLVHRYPDKALFLATSVCPVYCRFCTRSYSVGAGTETVSKKRFLPLPKRWETVFQHIEATPSICDIVVSGGDAYTLEPDQLSAIGDRLFSIPHVKRIRFASKGLAVCPSRMLDTTDAWTDSLIALSNQGRKIGKSVSLHTHFNHPREITWVTKTAAQRLFESAVTVRNQTVLLRGVNNDMDTMQKLIRRLAELNIQPYYVYQGDMVRGLEDLRTPLHEILELERQIRGTIAGFMTPSFVVDLPGGGGKRLAGSYESYDRQSGISQYRAPGVKGEQAYHYYDPLWSLSSPTGAV